MEHTQQVQYPAVRLSIVGDVALSSRFGTSETSQRFTTNTYADKKPPCNESFVRLSKGEESMLTVLHSCTVVTCRLKVFLCALAFSLVIRM